MQHNIQKKRPSDLAPKCIRGVQQWHFLALYQVQSAEVAASQEYRFLQWLSQKFHLLIHPILSLGYAGGWVRLLLKTKMQASNFHWSLLTISPSPPSARKLTQNDIVHKIFHFKSHNYFERLFIPRRYYSLAGAACISLVYVPTLNTSQNQTLLSCMQMSTESKPRKVGQKRRYITKIHNSLTRQEYSWELNCVLWYS